MALQVRGSWHGWSGHTLVELSDGTFWEQAEYLYEYRYAYRPEVWIEDGAMTVAGMRRPVRVRRVSAVRSTVAGTWHGWRGNTVVELVDGLRWQQAEYLYEYRYAYRPQSLLIGDKLQIEGMSRPVRVSRSH